MGRDKCPVQTRRSPTEFNYFKVLASHSGELFSVLVFFISKINVELINLKNRSGMFFYYPFCPTSYLQRDPKFELEVL
jgi:hypothetical protein